MGRDEEPQALEVPEDLEALLEEHPDARAAFETMSYSHRREYVAWIDEAEQEATRARRLAKTVTMLTEGKRLT